MKGVVFTELFAYVEERHSPTFLQEAINQSRVASKGVYTSTGTYPACEMASLLRALCDKTKVDQASLLESFGIHLFGRYAVDYPWLMEGYNDAYSLMAGIEDEIHKEVIKLYPDAELPTLKVRENSETRFQLVYESYRGLGDFCRGLIKGCLLHFDNKARLEEELIQREPETRILFTLHKE